MCLGLRGAFLCRKTSVTRPRAARVREIGAHFKQYLRDQLIRHKRYIAEHGDDMPEIREWSWPG